MRVDASTAQPWKVLEAANDAAISQSFEVGTTHIGDKCWVRAKGAHRQTGIVGVGQDIDNRHEVDVQP